MCYVLCCSRWCSGLTGLFGVVLCGTPGMPVKGNCNLLFFWTFLSGVQDTMTGFIFSGYALKYGVSFCLSNLFWTWRICLFYDLCVTYLILSFLYPGDLWHRSLNLFSLPLGRWRSAYMCTFLSFFFWCIPSSYTYILVRACVGVEKERFKPLSKYIDFLKPHNAR